MRKRRNIWLAGLLAVCLLCGGCAASGEADTPPVSTPSYESSPEAATASPNPWGNILVSR